MSTAGIATDRISEDTSSDYSSLNVGGPEITDNLSTNGGGYERQPDFDMNEASSHPYKSDVGDPSQNITLGREVATRDDLMASAANEIPFNKNSSVLKRNLDTALGEGIDESPRFVRPKHITIPKTGIAALPAEDCMVVNVDAHGVGVRHPGDVTGQRHFRTCPQYIINGDLGWTEEFKIPVVVGLQYTGTQGYATQTTIRPHGNSWMQSNLWPGIMAHRFEEMKKRGYHPTVEDYLKALNHIAIPGYEVHQTPQTIFDTYLDTSLTPAENATVDALQSEFVDVDRTVILQTFRASGNDKDRCADLLARGRKKDQWQPINPNSVLSFVPPSERNSALTGIFWKYPMSTYGSFNQIPESELKRFGLYDPKRWDCNQLRKLYIELKEASEGDKVAIQEKINHLEENYRSRKLTTVQGVMLTVLHYIKDWFTKLPVEHRKPPRGILFMVSRCSGSNFEANEPPNEQRIGAFMHQPRYSSPQRRYKPAIAHRANRPIRSRRRSRKVSRRRSRNVSRRRSKKVPRRRSRNVSRRRSRNVSRRRASRLN